MIRVLVRKENREQAMTAVALLILGVGVLFGIFVWRSGAPGDQVGNSQGDMWVPLVLAWMSGLIYGAQSLAGEYENGTMAWLDALPASRRHIWVGKVLGSLFVLYWQTVLLMGLAGNLGYFRKVYEQVATYPLASGVPFAALFVGVPLMGLAFGLFGSAVARTPMGAIGWALVAQAVCSVIVVLFVGLLEDRIRHSMLGTGGLIALVSEIPALALVISARRFGRLDRMRRAGKRSRPANSLGALLWLTWRQVRWLQVVVLIAGLLIASILPRTAPLAWPFFGLVFGAVLGISVFAPDQLGGAVRFLGERRLPFGRLWFVKTAVALPPLVVTILVFLLNAWLTVISRMSTGRDQAAVWQQLGFDRVVTPTMILLGPIYGFALGQFFGLVCRKGAVAAVLTLLSAGGVLAVWLPSMLIGGLSVWQWLGPPVVLIVASWLLMRPWVAGRLSDWRPACGIAAAGLLALGGMAFGIWWRVIAIPDVGPPFDVEALRGITLTPAQSRAADKMQLAARQFHAHYDSSLSQEHEPVTNGQLTTEMYYCNRACAALSNGWAPNPALNDWMDQVFAGEWLQTLREAVALPIGAMPLEPGDTAYQSFWVIRRLLCARGLQLQARGEEREALAMFRLAFDVERRLRARTSAVEYYGCCLTERPMLQSVALWAGNAVEHPELLRDALGMLSENERALPPLSETIETAYLMARQEFRSPDRSPNDFVRDVVGPAAFAPWEIERSHRLTNWLFAGWKRTATLDYRTAVELAEPIDTTQNPRLNAWLPPDPNADVLREREKLRRAIGDRSESLANWIPDQLFSLEPWTLACWRAARLQIALVLYEREHGQPAERLADLVPATLPELPLDPFNGEQFHYRVSKGEHITNSQPIHTGNDQGGTVKPGQGVIWSVSTNLADDGGVKNGGYFQSFGRGPPGWDLIFVVPRPAK